MAPLSRAKSLQLTVNRISVALLSQLNFNRIDRISSQLTHDWAAHTTKTVGVRSLEKFIYNLESKSMIGTVADPTEVKENNLACQPRRELSPLSEVQREGG